MKKWGCIIISMLMLGLLFTGCGDTTEPTAAPENPAQEESAGRIDQLITAWEDAGLTVEKMPDTGTKNVAMNMYYAVNGYQIKIDGNPVIVMEFDLANLNGVAQNYLDNIDETGTDIKTYEPNWRNGEFALMGTSDLPIDDHPQRDKIVEVFTGF